MDIEPFRRASARRSPILARLTVAAIAGAIAVATLAGCAAGPPLPLSPQQQAGLDAKRFVVVPLNVASSIPSELKGSTQIVIDAIQTHLEVHAKTVTEMHPDAGRALWLRSIREIKAKGGPRSFENAATLFAEHLQEETPFDVLIFPSLFVQNTTGSLDRSSKWDGAKHRLRKIGSMKNNKGALYGYSPMNVEAASLYVAVIDPKGNALHTKRAGLELIQHMALIAEKNFDALTYSYYDLRYNDPVIGDPERLQDGLARAFAAFLAEEPPTVSDRSRFGQIDRKRARRAP